MDEPALVAFRHEWAPPEPFPAAWPGDWVAETAWPPAGPTRAGLPPRLGTVPLVGGCAPAPPARPRRSRRSGHRPRPGPAAVLSWGAGTRRTASPGTSGPTTRRPDVHLGRRWRPTSTCSGAAAVVLTWESPAPVATAVVRLQDVAPDGTPSQVDAGILNLTHRDSHEHPAPLQPGAPTEVRIVLRATSHRFRAGHRIRLSVASSMWPVVWPSPAPAEYRLHLGGDERGPARAADRARRTVPPCRSRPSRRRPPGSARSGANVEPPVWEIVEDVIAGSVTVRSSEYGESVLRTAGRRSASASGWR